MAASVHLERSAACTSSGVQLVMQAYAQALQALPMTLATNAGLQAWQVVATLQQRHLQVEDAAWYASARSVAMQYS
jgi:chaperonin GroEL (HSP60 family)